MTASVKQSIQGSILGSGFFNIFISGLDNDMECNIRKAFNGTKLGGLADTTSGKVSLQRDLRNRGLGQQKPHEVQESENHLSWKGPLEII